MVELIFGLIPADILLWIVLFGMPFLIFLYFVVQDSLSAKKSLVLYYETEKVARLIEKKVEDGMIDIGKKRYYVDEANPPLVPTGTIVRSWRPFHVVKWNVALPQTFERDGVKTMTATNLKNFMENKALDQLLTPKGESKVAILVFIIGAVMGGLIGYLIANSGVIKGATGG